MLASAQRFLVVAFLVGAACRGPAETGPNESHRSASAANAIVVCGQRFPIDVPVVLWTEPPYYDASRRGPRFGAAASDDPGELRYHPGRKARDPELAAQVEGDGWSLEHLRRQVDLFVLHYDAAGTSQSCFKILHDRRGLSVHFLLDVDGTIYQTLDLKEQAWHARQANPRSIGVEIANIGAYEPGAMSPLGEWYREGTDGVVMSLPGVLGEGGVRTEDFVARPARANRIRGEVHGAVYEQYDFTPEQYRSLIALTAALMDVFPQIRLRAPRDARGRIRTDTLTDAEFQRFQGIIGHQHLSKSKRDPGPAFDWQRFLRAVARKLALRGGRGFALSGSCPRFAGARYFA